MAVKGEWLSTSLGRVKTGQVAAVAMTKGTILNGTGSNKGGSTTVWNMGVLSHDVALGEDTYTFPDGSIVLVQIASGVTANDRLISDTTATGKARTATSTEYSFGIALETAATADDWIQVKLKKEIVP